MKPQLWIGIVMLIGAIAGYIVFKLTGWLDATIGAVVGIIVGVLIYALLKKKK
ncbi:MAG: hypothetical protein WBV22_06700 [Anaerolineaceae bacterium]